MLRNFLDRGDCARVNRVVWILGDEADMRVNGRDVAGECKVRRQFQRVDPRSAVFLRNDADRERTLVEVEHAWTGIVFAHR